LYPQTGGNTKVTSKEFAQLAESYPTLLKKFNNNPINLLNNITKDCEQLIISCQFGAQQTLNSSACCAKLFSNVEYTLQYKCFSSVGLNDHTMWQARSK
jgi:hypothetical protein